MAVGDDEKPKLRCLDAGRYAVAFTVAVIVVVAIVHAVTTVLRPADLTVSLQRGYVSVKNVRSKVPPEALFFTFTLRASNPSGRVRIYFTNILASISRSLTVEDFFVCTVSDFVVGQQDASVVSVTGKSSNGMLLDDFNQLFGGGSIGNAILKLSGIRTVETYAGHNDTAKRVLYYCPSITVGGEDPEDAPPYTPCTEQLLASGGSTS